VKGDGERGDNGDRREGRGRRERGGRSGRDTLLRFLLAIQRCGSFFSLISILENSTILLLGL
jgi:hypothetical protein